MAAAPRGGGGNGEGNGAEAREFSHSKICPPNVYLCALGAGAGAGITSIFVHPLSLSLSVVGPAGTACLLEGSMSKL